MKTFAHRLPLALVIHLVCMPAAADTKLNALFMSQAAYSEADVREMTAAFEAANPGITVSLDFAPYETLRETIIGATWAGHDGYDVILFDVIWLAEFASRGHLLEVSDRFSSDTERLVFPGAWTTVDYQSRRYGMPWILDTKYLFFNRDILKNAGFNEPPKTWEELVIQARTIKDKGIVEYPLVWSWSQSEAMICDLATLTIAFGGDLVHAGNPTIAEPAARAAIEFMVSTLKDGLTNPASLNYLEEDVRREFSNGKAAFALNWSYMNGLANDPTESKVAGSVGVIASPGTDGGAWVSAINGSMGLGIPVNSRHPDEAWDYISFVSDPFVQVKHARLSLPIWQAAFSTSAVRDGQEDLVDAAREALSVMKARPKTPVYIEVSKILQTSVHSVLLQKSDLDNALADAARRMEGLLN
jgi:multiple sugar transport system substrate-binding protein